MTNTIHNPKVYLDALTSSDVFREERPKHPKARDALGSTALRYFENKDKVSEYHDVHTLAVALIGKLDSFKQARRSLESHFEGESKLNYQERQACKRDIVGYNHTIREIIDNNPAMTANEIVDFVAATEMLVGSPADSRYVTNATREIMTGMQHEIVVEQAVGSMPGTDFIDATIEDDLNGIDVSFRLDGIRYDLDVKASHMGVEKKLSQNNGHKSKVVPFWTGLEPGELGNKFRATNEQVNRVRSRLEAQLGLKSVAEVKTIA